MAVCLNGGAQNLDAVRLCACAVRHSYGGPCLCYVLPKGNYLTVRLCSKRGPVPLRACFWQLSPVLVLLLPLHQLHILSRLYCITVRAPHLAEDERALNRSCVFEEVLDCFDPGDHHRRQLKPGGDCQKEVQVTQNR